MTNEEEKLYWKGIYFPGVLTDAERSEFIRIVNKYDTIPETTPEQQKRWGYIMVAFYIAIVVALVFL